MTSTIKITYTILDGNLGALDGDEDAIEQYAADLQAAIEARYPDANVDVTVRWNTSGNGGGADVREIDERGFEVSPDDGEWDIEAVERNIGYIAEKLFETAGA